MKNTKTTAFQLNIINQILHQLKKTTHMNDTTPADEELEENEMTGKTMLSWITSYTRKHEQSK